MRGSVFFRCTDQRCMVDGNSHPDIPIFFDADGIIEPFSEYMIDLRFYGGIAGGTALTYAYQLQKFLKYLRSQSIDWVDVTDHVLVGWRERMIQREGLSNSTVAAYLNVAFAFYRWAEEKGRVVGSVRIAPAAQTNGSQGAGEYRISTKLATHGRGARFVWSGAPKQEDGVNRHTPTPEEIEELHLVASQAKTAERDTLILSFFEELFLRRAEALGFEVAAIPEWSEIEEAEQNDTTFTVEVRGKGNKARPVSMLPELASRARQYIEGERSRAVQRARKRNVAFVEPNALFLADTTGLPLTKQYLSRRISELMRRAGIDNASGHRLRAAGLTSLAEAYDGFDETGAPFPADQVLWKVAERAGHAHPRSLKPYLDLARSRNAISETESEIRQAGRERLSRRGKLLLPGSR